jgi:hypothetical protein
VTIVLIGHSRFRPAVVVAQRRRIREVREVDIIVSKERSFSLGRRWGIFIRLGTNGRSRQSIERQDRLRRDRHRARGTNSRGRDKETDGGRERDKKSKFFFGAMGMQLHQAGVPKKKTIQLLLLLVDIVFLLVYLNYI